MVLVVCLILDTQLSRTWRDFTPSHWMDHGASMELVVFGDLYVLLYSCHFITTKFQTRCYQRSQPIKVARQAAARHRTLFSESFKSKEKEGRS